MRSTSTTWPATTLTIIALVCISIVIGSPRAGESAFPGGNGVIAYYGTAGSSFEVFTMNADGTNRKQLTDALGTDSNPSWSVDGSQILFDSEREGGGFQTRDVFVMNADGFAETVIGTNLLPDDWNPVFSPDGQKIAFQSFRDGNHEIYVADANGDNAMNLTKNAASDRDPSWSPDGLKIAFTTDRDGDDDIYVMNADGSIAMNLTNHPGVDGTPDWSPDGSRIAFQSDRAGDPDVWVMNADGSNPMRLTDDLAADSDPAWSPDGARIAFQSDREGEFDIFVMNANGSAQKRLTSGPVHGRSPDWQPITAPPPRQTTWGDTDCSGAVAAIDALKTLQEVAGLPYGQTVPCFTLGSTVGVSPAGFTQRTWGDVDCDQDVDSVDALGIIRSVAARPVNQQPGCQTIGRPVTVVP